MAKIYLERLFNQTHYALDFIERLNSIEDFLALSEHTFDWQLRVELQRIQKLDEDKFPIPKDFDPRSYRTELMENAKERFTVTLPTFLRRTALMAFTSAVEIAAIDLKNDTKASFKLNFKQIKSKNDVVMIMKIFNDRLSLNGDKLLADFRNLVTVRNYLVHNRCDRKNNIDGAVNALGPRFRILRGKQVYIEHGALEPHISRMKDFIPKLREACHLNGLC